MNIKRFKFFESKEEESLLDTVTTVFSFLIDDGCIISNNNFGVIVKYKITSRSGIINNDIDEFLKWSDKLNDVVSDIKVAITRLSMINSDIAATFKYEIDNTITIKITKEDSIVFIKNTNSNIKLIYFSYPIIKKKFNLPNETSFQMGYLSGARALYITTPPADHSKLIEELSKVEGFEKHYVTPTGKLVFKFDNENRRYNYIS